MTGAGALRGEGTSGTKAWRWEQVCRASSTAPRPMWPEQRGLGETQEGSAPTVGLGLSLCVR